MRLVFEGGFYLRKYGICKNKLAFEDASFLGFFFIESSPQMCFEGEWLQNRLRADKNESRSLLAVDIQGHQLGGFCIAPSSVNCVDPRGTLRSLFRPLVDRIS